MKRLSESLSAAIIPRLMQIDSLWQAASDGPWQSWMDLDLSMSQFKLLLLIASHEGPRVGDLATLLQVTPPTVTSSLDRLVAQGLVRREDDPVDRRLVIARMTTQGRQLLQRLYLLSAPELTDCVNQLDEESRTCLARGIEALHRVVQARHAHNNGANEPDEC